VLTGGGARAAYQVGALRALHEILGAPPHAPTPFQVVVGVSAGAVNAVGYAGRADQAGVAVERLEAIWRSLTPDRVYRTDLPSLASIGARWFGSLTGGGLVQRGAVNHLLDTQPLRELLREVVEFDRIPQHFRSGVLHGVGLTATNYATGTAVTFYDGASEIRPWTRSTREGRRSALTLEHVMASSAIPVFFPPVPLEEVFWGDGSIRLTAPLSPAIHLGADRLVVISVQHRRSPEHTAELNREATQPVLSLASISGVLLDSVFLDSVEADLERLQRINRTVSLIPQERLHSEGDALRPIPTLVLRPSRDLASLPSARSAGFPPVIRYLLAGIGARGTAGTELSSYLAFEERYVRELIELGAADTLERRAEIERFFAAPEPVRASS
jgi:NTE family protein